MFSTLLRRYALCNSCTGLCAARVSICSPIITSSSPAAPLTQQFRTSVISNNKVEGYYRLQPRDIVIPSTAYETLASRGNGPGGQGAQSSSNKIEMRVRMSSLAELLDEETFSSLRQKHGGHGGAITADGEWLIVTAYEHRSGLKNKEECLTKVKELIADCTWVAPVAADPIQTSSSTIAYHKTQRRIKSNKLKARNMVRRGIF